MTTLKLTLLASAATLALAGPTLAAANRMNTLCNGGFAWCAYNQTGQLLGVLQQVNLIWREMGGQLYFAGYTSAGLTQDLALFYASADCSGQPYQMDGYVAGDGVTIVPDGPPAWAQWSGTQFWAPIGPAEAAPMQSNVCYGVVCNGNPEGQCVPYSGTGGPSTAAFAPAAVVQTPSFAKPTPACEAAQNCVVVK